MLWPRSEIPPGQFVPCYLTKRFHVAVRMFSNRSQMTSECGSVTDVFTTI